MGQEYELSVEARDRGSPQRSSVADLHVQVINAEDESPRFPISFYTAEISEGKWSVVMFSVDLLPEWVSGAA